MPETAAPPQGLPVQAAEEKPKRELKGEPLAADVPFKTPHAEFLKKVLEDALTRLVLPSLEREIRGELTDEAETHAVAVFARNLRSLLLQPPLHNRRLLAIDPGFRTGCKVAVLDVNMALAEKVAADIGGVLEKPLVELAPSLRDRGLVRPEHAHEADLNGAEVDEAALQGSPLDVEKRAQPTWHTTSIRQSSIDAWRPA